MTHVRRVDVKNLFILNGISLNQSSEKELAKIKKHVKKINTFVINEYKYGGGSNFIELFFLRKRITKLNKLLEKYNVCVCISLSSPKKM